MEKHHIEVMLPEEKVDARIREIGEQISIFSADLLTNLTDS